MILHYRLNYLNEIVSYIVTRDSTLFDDFRIVLKRKTDLVLRIRS